jgi:hypothetical protein
MQAGQAPSGESGGSGLPQWLQRQLPAIVESPVRENPGRPLSRHEITTKGNKKKSVPQAVSRHFL